MKNIFFYCLITMFAVSSSFSQRLTEEFVVEKPTIKVKSIYDKLIVIDSRRDKSNVGIIQKGAFNRNALLIDKIPLNTQFENAFKNMITDNSSSGELVLNIREFKFAEISGDIDETGFCNIRAELFSKKDTIYTKIAKIDLVSKVNDKEVTKQNIAVGTKKIIDFIYSNILFEKTGDKFSLYDIMNIDKIEKKTIPIYNNTTYKDGVYLSFTNFKNQTPDYSSLKANITNKGDISKIEIKDDSGNELKENRLNIYAIIYEGKIFKATEFGYYPLEFKNSDFHFNGKVRVSDKTNYVPLGFYGAIEVLAVALVNNPAKDFENIIDHLTGEIMPLIEIK